MYTTATVWGHEAFAHAERHLGNISTLREKGIISYKEKLQSQDPKMDHSNVNYGYNDSFISYGNELGNMLKSRSASEAAMFKSKFIKTGIDYYNSDAELYTEYMGGKVPPKRSPNEYLNF